MTAISTPQPPVSSPSPPPPPPPRSRRHGGRIVAIVVGVLAVVVAAGVVALVVAMQQYGRAPDFPSLADTPDTSLHGTIAYLSHEGAQPCLYASLVSGAATRRLQCFERVPGGFPGELTWLADGRLRATAFAESPTRAPTHQWLYDVRTGTTTEVPADQIVDTGRPAGPSTLNAAGERVTATSDAGHVELVVTGPAGRRTLLSAGAGEGYALDAPVWSPDGRWILVHDNTGRLLVTTTDEPSTTRALGEQHGEDVAIAAEDLVPVPSR